MCIRMVVICTASWSHPHRLPDLLPVYMCSICTPAPPPKHAPCLHPPLCDRVQAASPDEEALVAGAAYLGTKLLAR